MTRSNHLKGYKTLFILVFLITVRLFSPFSAAPDFPASPALSIPNGYAESDFSQVRRDPSVIPKGKQVKNRADEDDLEELMALSYLQGYNPATEMANVTRYDKNSAFPGYNVYASAHALGAYLMDMEGNVLHQWRYDFTGSKKIGPKEMWRSYWGSLHLFGNGDLLVLFNLKGLMKLDKHSNLLWFYKTACHHHLFVDDTGTIYALSQNKVPISEQDNIRDNSIIVLSADGKLLKKVSLYGLFERLSDDTYLREIRKMARDDDASIKEGWGKLPGFVRGDVFHANSLEILDGKLAQHSPIFKKGNALLSLRHLGVVMIVDLEAEKIVWIEGPGIWNKGQHDAHLLDDGNILLFDNYFGQEESRVIEFDPLTKKIVWEYRDPEGRFFSHSSGRCSRLPNGNTLIVETVNGRIFEVTADQRIVWEFYNPHRVGKNNELMALIHCAIRLRPDFPLDWLK